MTALSTYHFQMSALLEVLLVTGPLGSGKTTVVNRLLHREIEAQRRVALLINEFGTVSVDDALLAAHHPELAGVENLVNGCACCSLRSEVVAILDTWSSLPEGKRPHLMDLDQEETLRGKLRLAGCLTVISCLTPLHHLEKRLLVRHQVALASLVYVSKADLDPSLAMAWESQIRSLFRQAKVVSTHYGQAPQNAPDPWKAELGNRSDDQEPSQTLGFSEARSLAVTWNHPVDPEALEALFLGPVPKGELLRAKGVTTFAGWPNREDGSDRWAFHIADGRVEIMPLPPLPDGAASTNVAVVIGVGLDMAAWRKALVALERPPVKARRKGILRDPKSITEPLP
jgi:G3E family GTPase